MQVNHGQIIYPQNLKNTLAQFIKFDLIQRMVTIKLSHLGYLLKLQISNIKKNFHHNKRLNLN